MNTTVSTHTVRNSRAKIAKHKVPTCPTTGLPRYRERRQARHAAAASTSLSWEGRWAVFQCIDCAGFHLEKLTKPHHPVTPRETSYVGLAAPRRRRFVLVDIENLTAGQGSYAVFADLWQTITAVGLTGSADHHVVIGASRPVAKRFSTAIAGPNVRWVVGSHGPDGADRALLAACNTFQVAKRYEELVIMSGDHVFAGVARQARRRGLRVHVVTTERVDGYDPLSRELAAAADEMTTLTVTHQRSAGREMTAA